MNKNPVRRIPVELADILDKFYFDYKTKHPELLGQNRSRIIADKIFAHTVAKKAFDDINKGSIVIDTRRLPRKRGFEINWDIKI